MHALLATARARLAGEAARRWWNSAVDVLFPPTCANCLREIENPIDDVLFCAGCRHGFIDNRPACVFCGAGLPEFASLTEKCPHCQTDRFQFSSVIRLGDYDGPLQHALLAAKAASHAALAMHLGRLMAVVRGAEIRSLAADAIVAVPAFWTRRSEHGHNSAETMAEELAIRLRLPHVRQMLLRTRPTKRQTSLTPKERRQNVQSAFAVRPHPDLAGARLLLVDDVLTTGATANESARTLLKAGAEAVVVLAIARAVGG